MNMLNLGAADVSNFPAPIVLGRRDGDAVWQNLARFAPDNAQLRRNRLELGKDQPGSGVWDEMRTRTALAMISQDWHVLGVTSPTAGCGSTTLAFNLAAGLSRQNNCRVVLIDFNLRKPALAKLLRFREEAPLAEYLLGRRAAGDSLTKVSDSLAIAFNDKREIRSSEVLLDASVQRTLAELRRQLSPEYLILDLPPMIGSDEALACLPLLDCALLVAAANKTSFGEIDLCERELTERTGLLGIALNMCRDGPGRYGY